MIHNLILAFFLWMQTYKKYGELSPLFYNFVIVNEMDIIMRIEHIAIWAEDIERLRDFYTTYFEMRCGDKYVNPKRGFTSYFLSFAGETSRLELMNIPGMTSVDNRDGLMGLAHLAISVGSKEAVNNLTERLRMDGYRILSEPRTTGDGYYESAVADPEGNYVEIIA